jgi:hypothetical protein
MIFITLQAVKIAVFYKALQGFLSHELPIIVKVLFTGDPFNTSYEAVQ